jgi:hypothetical protein
MFDHRSTRRRNTASTSRLRDASADRAHTANRRSPNKWRGDAEL